MIKKLWVKFDNEANIECLCDEHHKKCNKESHCKEYVVKFTEIDRTDEKLEEAVQNFNKVNKRLETEIEKSIRKLKRFKI